METTQVTGRTQQGAPPSHQISAIEVQNQNAVRKSSMRNKAHPHQSEKGSHVTISKVGSVEMSGKEEAFSNMSGANDRLSQDNLALLSNPSSDPSNIPTNTNGNKNWNTNIRKIKIDFAAQKR